MGVFFIWENNDEINYPVLYFASRFLGSSWLTPQRCGQSHRSPASRLISKQAPLHLRPLLVFELFSPPSFFLHTTLFYPESCFYIKIPSPLNPLQL